MAEHGMSPPLSSDFAVVSLFFIRFMNTKLCQLRSKSCIKKAILTDGRTQSTRSSVILSAYNSTTPTGRISMKFRIWWFYCNFSIHPEFGENQGRNNNLQENLRICKISSRGFHN
jgi:hypothetical protein